MLCATEATRGPSSPFNRLRNEPYKEGAQNRPVKGDREGVAEQGPLLSHNQKTSQVKNHSQNEKLHNKND
jgi:hypothetical protein